MGWKGKSTSHPFDILEDMTIVKNVSNLIESARFSAHHVFEKIDSNAQLEKAMYPHGQCISLTLPSQMNSVIELKIVFNLKFIQDNKIENIRIVMKDPNIDVKSLSPLYALAEDTFIEKHAIIYNLEIFLTKSLEADPKANCQTITEEYSFKECFGTEIITKFRDLIGCILPWFTDVRGDICSQTVTF